LALQSNTLPCPVRVKWQGPRTGIIRLWDHTQGWQTTGLNWKSNRHLASPKCPKTVQRNSHKRQWWGTFSEVRSQKSEVKIQNSEFGSRRRHFTFHVSRFTHRVSRFLLRRVHVIPHFAKPLQLINQRPPADAQRPRRLRPVEIVLAQRLDDGLPLNLP
jgi:hypothetical protein